MAANAACRVFRTTELLENVLLHLDLEADTPCLCELLSVSRDFNDTILESPRLRDRMWIPTPMSPYGSLSPIYNYVQQNGLLHHRSGLFEPFNIRHDFRIDVSLSRLRQRSKRIEDCFQGLAIARKRLWRKMAVFKNVPCPIIMGLNDSSAPMSAYSAFGIIYVEPEDTLGDLGDKLQEAVRHELLMGIDQRR